MQFIDIFFNIKWKHGLSIFLIFDIEIMYITFSFTPHTYEL